MKFRDKLLAAVVPWIGSLLIRTIYLSQRVSIHGEEALREEWAAGRHLIFCFWHDQLLLMIKGYRGPGTKILISASKDGELIARTMEHFGHGSVRGSSSRGARQAFRELMTLTADKVDLAVTPDGPKGPRHQLKDGVIQLARISGRPVVPMAYVCSRGYRFRSWDRFLLPAPFARAVYSYAPPLFFSRDEPLDDCRQRLEQAMAENQQRAEAHLESAGVSAV
ncbi:MAG: lysophospholipid acyltransferase family protein [Desulfoarculaceae bacterium]|nr:lysophospholipid acyltransferase family protein [Desulfoarculaceae bacterium]